MKNPKETTKLIESLKKLGISMNIQDLEFATIEEYQIYLALAKLIEKIEELRKELGKDNV